MAFQRVATLGQIPSGSGLRVEIDGIDVGLFRVEDEVYALENRCPHAGFPLSDGELLGCVVICPVHGWDFDVRTGFKPGEPDGFPIPCFAVKLDGEHVLVDLDDVTNRRGRTRSLFAR